MMLKIFTAYDVKTQTFMQPFFLRSQGEAKRAFTQVANDREHLIGGHPGDFTLFEIGEFDDSTGRLTYHEMHENLGSAISYQTEEPTPMFPPQGAHQDELASKKV